MKPQVKLFIAVAALLLLFACEWAFKMANSTGLKDNTNWNNQPINQNV